MKKLSLKGKKVSLNKETIASLNQELKNHSAERVWTANKSICIWCGTGK